MIAEEKEALRLVLRMSLGEPHFSFSQKHRELQKIEAMTSGHSNVP